MYIAISLVNSENIPENILSSVILLLHTEAVKPQKMPIASTIIIITIGVGVATMIGVIGNEIRLFIKDQKNGVDREKKPFDYMMYHNIWGSHAF